MLIFGHDRNAHLSSSSSVVSGSSSARIRSAISLEASIDKRRVRAEPPAFPDAGEGMLLKPVARVGACDLSFEAPPPLRPPLGTAGT